MFADLRDVYAALDAGRITEAEATVLDEQLRPPLARRPGAVTACDVARLRAAAMAAGTAADSAAAIIAAVVAAEVAARFAPPRRHGRFHRAPYQRSPDRQRSLERRKTLAATWPVPPAMAAKLTPSEVAYCRLIADDHARQGYFDRCHDEAAARIGTCAKTIQRAEATLRTLGWITVQHRPHPGRKHLSNVLRIIAPAWLAWIEHGPKPRPAPPRLPKLPLIGGQNCHATENQYYDSGASRVVIPAHDTATTHRNASTVRK